MNCMACVFKGNCKVWEQEDKFFNSVPELPPPIHHLKIFKVTPEGAYCQHFTTDPVKNTTGGQNDKM